MASTRHDRIAAQRHNRMAAQRPRADGYVDRPRRGPAHSLWVVTTWVLERDVFADSDEALAEAVTVAGGAVLDWRDDWWWDGRVPKLDGPVVFHGSLANADRIARELPWDPGSICATDSFACSAWWPRVPNELVSAEHIITTAADLATTGAPPAFGDRVFVRPDGALKPFSGRVLERDNITLAALDHGFYFDDETLPVVVTPVVPVEGVAPRHRRRRRGRRQFLRGRRPKSRNGLGPEQRGLAARGPTLDTSRRHRQSVRARHVSDAGRHEVAGAQSLQWRGPVRM